MEVTLVAMILMNPIGMENLVYHGQAIMKIAYIDG